MQSHSRDLEPVLQVRARVWAHRRDAVHLPPARAGTMEGERGAPGEGVRADDERARQPRGHQREDGLHAAGVRDSTGGKRSDIHESKRTS